MMPYHSYQIYQAERPKTAILAQPPGGGRAGP